LIDFLLLNFKKFDGVFPRHMIGKRWPIPQIPKDIHI